MKLFITPLIPAIIFMILCIVPLSIIIFIFKKQIRHKRSPLNMELLRSPGQTLQGLIEELSTDIIIKALLIPVLPIVLHSVYTIQVSLSAKHIGGMTLSVYLLGSMAVIFFLCNDVLKMIKKRNLLRLGYECEVAVGQELNQLVHLGFNIFHDFPAENFNIDHIAVGPQGVFAIETKGRSKNRKKENNNWKIKFDGKSLIFPDWTEDKPLKQAKRQSSWLAKWIDKSTGEKHKVTSVLALPGWWIDRTAPSDLKIFNGKNPSFLAKGPVVLNDKQIKSISFQIDKECRDVETKAYNI